MGIHHVEEIVPDISFEGTVIDFETIGTFDHAYKDLRKYFCQQPVIFGRFSHNKLEISYIEDEKDLKDFHEFISQALPALDPPLHAYNVGFEMGILINITQKLFEFQELQGPRIGGRYESKTRAREQLGIPWHGDPFNGKGKKCMIAWYNRDFENCIKHNRACCLIEAEILLRRGSSRINITKETDERTSQEIYFIEK